MRKGVIHILPDDRLGFLCPACGCLHFVDHRWSFAGDYDRPTFSPSIRVNGVAAPTDEELDEYARTRKLPAPRPFVCHSFVTAGKIQFLGDCTHELAGRTVDLTTGDD
ncbi:DUF6527 family protein [Methylosinus sp. PW1]|uniref:DUF6527 family protein n=1 Tax=Methylosinus sp. PW1 TaxID=107636 RepID=UPI00056A337F|nr:DUF6527 family protein [Methylosinus sp. PW1]